MESISNDSIKHLSMADLWAMYQYSESMRIEAQKAYEMYKAREYAEKYKMKVDYWAGTIQALSTEINKRVNQINPMYP